MASTRETPFICSICGVPVKLEGSKVGSHGFPVHAACAAKAKSTPEKALPDKGTPR